MDVQSVIFQEVIQTIYKEEVFQRRFVPDIKALDILVVDKTLVK